MARKSKEEVVGTWRRKLEMHQNAVLELLLDMPMRVYEELRQEKSISKELHGEFIQFLPDAAAVEQEQDDATEGA